MLVINRNVSIPLYEIVFTAMRAQGPGGQAVNKTNSAVHLRFDVENSSLLRGYKDRIMAHSDHRITKDGVIVIKAQSHRNQERNKEDALERLRALLQAALKRQAYRRPTQPSRSSTRRNIKKAQRRSEIKSLRGRVRRTDD